MAIAWHIYNKIKTYLTPNIKILELGDQILWYGQCCDCSHNWGNHANQHFKNVFPHLDITSLDLNGINGSLTVNLSNPIPEWLLNQYDLITNFGTSEHVQNQYHLWKNVFDMLKPGGLIINDIPLKDSWPGHCKYYATETTFTCMAQDFEVIESHMDYWSPQGYLYFSILKRKHNDSFQTSEQTILDNMHIIHDFKDFQGV
jgi:SAM-dependent methyltransferase